MRVLHQALLLGCLTTTLSIAQESRGGTLGRITDRSGASVAQAKITATNLATNTQVTSRSNAEGNYDIPYLLPGAYRGAVESAGFSKAIREGIELRTADRLALNFQLLVGALTDSVTVSAETPLLETTTTSSGLVMDERRVKELPFVGGNPMDLGGATGVIVNGTSGGNSEASLDGVPNMQGPSAAFSPPQDLVQEFKVQTTNYDVSMKSGTNQLHGTVYLNDSRIRAVSWFSNGFLHNPATGPINDAKRCQANPGWLHQRWGATASGPIRIPKAYDGRNCSFWTFGYQGVEINRQPTVFATVPYVA